jgi:predicted Na+-dependent transporter
VLAPLLIGIAIRMWRGPGVQRWSTPLATASNLLVLFIIVLVLIRYSDDVADSAGRGVVAVAAITVVAALGAGWTIGAPYPGLRVVVALVTAIRANGLALAIAQASFPSRPATQAAVVTFGVFSIVVPTVVALGIAGWRGRLFNGSAQPDR